MQGEGAQDARIEKILGERHRLDAAVGLPRRAPLARPRVDEEREAVQESRYPRGKIDLLAALAARLAPAVPTLVVIPDCT